MNLNNTICDQFPLSIEKINANSKLLNEIVGWLTEIIMITTWQKDVRSKGIRKCPGSKNH